MSNILINNYLRFVILAGRRLASTENNVDIGGRMKMLNDNKQHRKVLELFDAFNEKNIDKCSNWIIIQALKACTQICDVQYGLKIHNLISSRLKHDPYVLPSLIHLYMQCSDVNRAESLFNTSTKKTLPIYGAMMKGYIKNNLANKAANLFKDIQNPDLISIILLFNACAQLRTHEALNLVKIVSSKVPQGFHSNPYVLTSLIDAFMKCGDIKSAQSVFHASTQKALSMYGAMMKGYLVNNMPNKAITLFKEIHDPDKVIVTLFFNACAQLGTHKELDLIKTVSSNIPESFHLDSNVLTSLIDAFMKCDDMKSAQSLFQASTKKTLSMYGAMMKGYLVNNMPNKAITLFKEIHDPDKVIVTLFFNACAQLGTDKELDLIKIVSSNISKSFHSSPYVVTSLIDGFMKCGDMKNAQAVFQASTKKTLSMYAAMMAGFNKNELAEKAVDIFNGIHHDEFYRKNDTKNEFNLLSKMKNDCADGNIIIYLCMIKALAKIGMLETAKSFVQRIPSFFLVDRRIQNALIDMWGKVDSVDEAKRIFRIMSQPDHIGYTAMINSYGLNGMGVEAVEFYRQMPKELIHESTYVCVLNACSHSGLVAEARLIFNNIQTKTEIIYTTMIDCLSRAVAFDEARELMEKFERDHPPSVVMHTALLSGARNNKNSKLSQDVVDRMKKLFPDLKSSLLTASILLANVYASSGDIEKSTDIKMELHKSGAKKQIGVTMTDIDGKIWRFRAHDQSHAESAEIHEQADRMSKRIIEHGHKYDASWVVRPVEPDETIETLLCGHSERLAMAAHFIRNRKPKRIQMTKNLRICGDCHQVTKLVALIYQCEIVVRDANRIHHFHMNGQCSCQDYF
ncbi:unnamed protein product [Rotaria socialis]